MRKLKKPMALVVSMVVGLTVALTGCGSSTASAGKGYPTKNLEFIAPSGAGGGWDLTIRTVAKVLQDNKLVSVPMPVTNKTGGGGGVNLAYMQEKKGSDTLVSVYSPPLILINLNGSTNLSYKNTTPLAKLLTDYGAFVVAKDSKYKTIKDVMDALKKDPKSVKVGGNSSAGSMDHVQFLLMAKAAGITNLKDIDYVAFQDNSGAAQVMGGHIDVFSTGVGGINTLIDSGKVRALATTAPKRVGEGVVKDIPTCKESGIDATFENWRGLFGAPEMPEYAVKFWQDTLEKMVKTEDWKKACATNGWDEAFSKGADFSKFLDEQNESCKAILQEIGMLKEAK